MIEISTRRDGPSGKSFAIRLVQCEPLRLGYIAEGDSEADLVRDPAPKLTQLVNGSISDVVAKHACVRHDEPKPAMSALEPTEATQNPDAEKRVKLEEDVRKAVEYTDLSVQITWYGSGHSFFAEGLLKLIHERPCEIGRRSLLLGGEIDFSWHSRHQG